MASNNETQATPFIASFFSTDYSFEVERICRDAGISLRTACKIQFWGNNTVQQYGRVTRGAFESDADVAGLGIWWGSFAGLVICGIAFLFLVREALRLSSIKRRTRGSNNVLPVSTTRKRAGKVREFVDRPLGGFYRVMRTLVMTATDTQILVALAYGLNFGLGSKCTQSAYHYNVGINTILCACVSITLSVAIIRDYWRGFLAPLFRTLLAAVIFGVLGRMLWYQRSRSTSPETVAWAVGWENNKGNNTDSTIFLPMACFLDPDLDPLKGLNKIQKERVGGNSSANTWEFSLYWPLVLLFVLGHACHLIRLFSRRRGKVYADRGFIRSGGQFLCYLVCIAYCIGVYAAFWSHVNRIRSFVHGSGWIKGGNTDENPEHSIRGIGQILPIVTIFGWIILTSLDSIRGPKQKDEEVVPTQVRRGKN